MKRVGTIVLLLGLLVTVYGVVGFFFLNSLPPNGGTYGRLPSLYLLLGGAGVMLVGTVVRGFRLK